MEHATYMYVYKDGSAGSCTTFTREEFVEHLNALGKDVLYAFDVLKDNYGYMWVPFKKEQVTTERWV